MAMTNDWQQHGDDLVAAGSGADTESPNAVPTHLAAHGWDPPDPATIAEAEAGDGAKAGGGAVAGTGLSLPPRRHLSSRRQKQSGWFIAAAAIGAMISVGTGALQLHANSATSATEQVIAGGAAVGSNGVVGSNGGNGSNGGSGLGGGIGGDTHTVPLSPGQGLGFVPGNGFGANPDPGGVGGQGSSTSQVTAKATGAQQVGVVDINTVLGLQNARAAGTGMIVTSTGEILTNNHVIKGATAINVTVVVTGKVYTAGVVGYSATQDIAVLQLVGASGLDTVSISTALPVLGAGVTGVGNAGGVGGVPGAAPGKVVAVNQSITAADDNGASAEQLIGLIQTDAPIAAGDSGGPLFDSSDAVIGMDTAASTKGATQAFAIPMKRALEVAVQIESGKASDIVHIGATGYLGVQVTDQAGALVAGVVDGSPAAKAGLVAGDVIISVDGHLVASATVLTQDMSALGAGASARIGWTDAAGVKHSASITLAAGPAR